MNIQFKPKDENHPPDKRAFTDIGSFYPDEIRGVGPDQEMHAQRLVDNGDFVFTDVAPNTDEVTTKLPKAMEKWNAAADAKKKADALKPKVK